MPHHHIRRRPVARAMSASLATADTATHLKVVALALAAATFVLGVTLLARLDGPAAGSRIPPSFSTLQR
jgi:hypothetical protein